MIRVALGLVLSLGLVAAAPAEAAIGVDGVNPPAGAPGESVELSIACGWCLAVSVAEGPRHPPAALPVSLVPLARAPKPHPCRGGKALCSPAVVGPPRERPFVFLGKAVPLFEEEELRRMSDSGRTPRYRLRFRIPRVKPGAYAFVIYGDNERRGARGTLIVDPTSHLLHVRPGDSISSAGTGTGKDWWIAAGAAFFLLAGGAVLLRGRLGR